MHISGDVLTVSDFRNIHSSLQLTHLEPDTEMFLGAFFILAPDRLNHTQIAIREQRSELLAQDDRLGSIWPH